MTFSTRGRQVLLTAHVASSVGWLGTVAASLALAIAGVASREPQTVRAAYVALELLALTVLIPLSLASLLTGVVQSLGTHWGLVRHWWVVVKLAINLLATGVLVMYTQTLTTLADAATRMPAAHVDTLRSPSPVLHAAAGLLLLTAATVLAVVKPRGLTPYGRRRERMRPARSAS